MEYSALFPFKGTWPRLKERVFVDESAKLIGDVEVGDDSSIWPFVLVRGDVNYIRIGVRTNIQDGTIIHVSNDTQLMPGGSPTIIGDEVTIGHGAMLHGCIIEDVALIGMRATLLDRSRVEKYGVLGAGSLLPPNKVVKSGELWVGSPAKFVRRLTDKEIENLYFSAAHYVDLKSVYLEEKNKLLKGQ